MLDGTDRGRTRQDASAPLLRLAATVVAAAFLLIGILGFVPGITTDYYELTFAGYDSGAELFGVFQVSVLHNLLHLLFGLVGLVLARRVAGARLFLIVGGLIYLALWLYGFLIGHTHTANVIPLNGADNWLHLGLGLGMLALGLVLSPRANSDAKPLDRPRG